MKTRIAIIGLGGVGGYIGALLADKYAPSDEVEIIFIATERTAAAIKTNGFKLLTEKEDRVVSPEVITSATKSTAPLNLLICAVKSYSLEESLSSVKHLIAPQTVILTLLNGVDSKDRIRKLFPSNEIWEGAIYIVSRQTEPGVIKQTGTHALYFGSESVATQELNQLNIIFKEAGINSHVAENSTRAVWEKFLFLSVIASLTSYLDLSIGGILTNENRRKMLVDMLYELKSIADANNTGLPADAAEKALAKMEGLPYETTSSMHDDYKKGSRTEYKTLTEYVVELGARSGVETPTYKKVLEGLLRKNSDGSIQ